MGGTPGTVYITNSIYYSDAGVDVRPAYLTHDGTLLDETPIVYPNYTARYCGG